MITRFTAYIKESRKSLDELETLTPNELWEIMNDEIHKMDKNMGYIQDLIDAGCPIDARDNLGWTALHWGVFDKHPELVEMLLSGGAELNALDHKNRSPLYVATKGGNLEIIRLLLSKGAQVDIKDDMGFIPWDYASYRVKRDIPELEPNYLIS